MLNILIYFYDNYFKHIACSVFILLCIIFSINYKWCFCKLQRLKIFAWIFLDE